MAFYTVCFIAWTSLFGFCLSTDICKYGEYFDTTLSTCTTCSTRCPENQVIRRTCQGDQDIECGPLFELSGFFKQQSRDQFIEENLASNDLHVQQLETAMHEDDALVFVLLAVLLALTGLLIVLALVALVMYRRRYGGCAEIKDPEKELPYLEETHSLTREFSVETDKVALVPSQIKPTE